MTSSSNANRSDIESNNEMKLVSTENHESQQSEMNAEKKTSESEGNAGQSNKSDETGSNSDKDETGEEATQNDDGLPAPTFSLCKKRSGGLHIFFTDIRKVAKLDGLGREIAGISIPAALALAADPFASLVDTAFIGRLGSVEIAAVGVAIAIFNQVSKVAIYPLVSVTTSFVAEEDAICSKIAKQECTNIENPHALVLNDKASPDEVENTDLEKGRPEENTEQKLALSGASDRNCGNSHLKRGRVDMPKCGNRERRYVSSVSSALVVGGVLGIVLAIFLIFAAKFALRIMGVKSGSPMLAPACRYLTLRSLGAPAVLLSLAMQGVFRGFKDTKTPLYATVTGDVANIILDPIFIFLFRMGISGAAIAHVISQYLITLILLCRLVKLVDVIPASMKALKFSRFLKCGFMLLARVTAATFCVTLAASLAARHGPTPMAAFQICLQVWMSTSLLADGLAVAGQAILASSFAKKDYPKVVAATSRVLQLSIVLGLALAFLLGIGMDFGSRIFTKDINVVKLIHKALPFVAATQPINSLAFVFDGINYGASDYTYAGCSMVLVAVFSVIALVFLSSSHGFIGIWIALTIYMTLRTFAGVWRMGAVRGPWTFLRHSNT